MKNFIMTAAMVLGLAGISFAQLSANGTAQINARLLAGLQMNVTGSVDFGTIATASGTYNSTSNAVFKVTGTAGANIQISSLPSSVTLSDTSSGAAPSTPITFTPTLNTSTNGSTSTGTAATATNYTLIGTFPSAGDFYFLLSGKITLTGSETPGSYNGSYTLDVAYN